MNARRLLAAAAGITLAVIGTAAPVKADTPRLAWILTSSGKPSASTPATSKAAAEDDDLKTECGKHPEAQTDQGWPHSRFDQCFLRTRMAFVLTDVETHEAKGEIDFTSSLLALAYDGTRRIDYVFNFDDYSVDLRYPVEIYNNTTLTVSFDGCTNPLITCSPIPQQIGKTAADWALASSRNFVLTVTSDNDTGAGDFKIVRSLIDMDFSVVSTDPHIVPFQQAMAFSRGRFDSAGNKLGGGKYWGAVMTDFVPTVTLDKSANSTYRAEAKHVDDALHHPNVTFPSFAGKHPPGEGDRPLHRLMDEKAKNDNSDAAKKICRSVWGDNYTNNNLDCDEYPFKSTYEGANKSTGGNPFIWQGSARPINSDQNQIGGNVLQSFYGLNRILDENVGTDQTGPTDPFRVAVIG